MAKKEVRDKHGNLRRQPHELPEDVKVALEQNSVRADYDARPAYQRKDYLAWIIRAQHPDLRKKRLNQMLKELEVGGIFLRADHPASKK